MKTRFDDLAGAPAIGLLTVQNKEPGDVIAHGLDSVNVFIWPRDPTWGGKPSGPNAFELLGPPGYTYTGDIIIIRGNLITQ